MVKKKIHYRVTFTNALFDTREQAKKFADSKNRSLKRNKITTQKKFRVYKKLI